MSKASQRKNRKQQKQRASMQQQVGLLVIVLVVVGVLAWAFFSGGQSAAMDFEGTSIDGETVRLSDYRGQVVMLNFWATWCPPCRAEMPAIQAAYMRHQNDGFVVLAINNRETVAQILPFVTSYGLDFPIVLDTSARIQQAFAVNAFPTSIFVNGNGEAYATHTGAVTPEQLEEYIATGMAQTLASTAGS